MNGARLLDGKALARRIREELKEEVARLSVDRRPPGLAVVRVGDDPASEVYVRRKRKACEEVGIRSWEYHLPSETPQKQLLEQVARLNADPEVDGILVQLPLPSPLDEGEVLDAIDPAKDVDGFHPVNVGRLWSGLPGLVPCTPLGIIELLRSTGHSLPGLRAVVVGRSNIVGKPVAALLLREHMTVSVAHSRTRDLPGICQEADVLVVAVGRPRLVSGEWVKPGAVVIDVGINRMDDGSLVGDVDFEGARRRAAYITPVPGGVGPMTIAMLLRNTVQAYRVRTGA